MLEVGTRGTSAFSHHVQLCLLRKCHPDTSLHYIHRNLRYDLWFYLVGDCQQLDCIGRYKLIDFGLIDFSKFSPCLALVLPINKNKFNI